MASLSSESRAPATLSSLPYECKNRIVQYLCTRDAASLRKTSSVWSGVCVAGMFNQTSDGNLIEAGGLSLRPHLPDDMTRILEISSRRMAKHVTHIKIFIGDIFVDKLVWHSQRCSKFWYKGGRRTEAAAAEVHGNFIALLKRMEDNLRDSYCNYVDLCTASLAFHNVDSLMVTSAECPFVNTDSHAYQAWS